MSQSRADEIYKRICARLGTIPEITPAQSSQAARRYWSNDRLAQACRIAVKLTQNPALADALEEAARRLERL